MSEIKRTAKIKTKAAANDELTAVLNEFAERAGSESKTDAPPMSETLETATEGASVADRSDPTEKPVSASIKKMVEDFESRAFHPIDRRTEVAVDSLESCVGYSSLIRQMHHAFIRRVAYHRSKAGGSLSVEAARAEAFHACTDREEAEKLFDHLMSLPKDCLGFVELENLYAFAPRTAEGFWELVKSEARVEFESGHLAANITFPEDYMQSLWNIARYLGVRESFADDWRPQGGIEVAMIDMMTQSWFQWQYWLEQTVRRSQTRERETHPQYNQWLAQRGMDLKDYGITDGYWHRPLVSEQEALDKAVQMADRFNRIFMRTLRQLRDLRRYAPVTINNPQQVNIAADGGQQVNVNKG